MSKDVLVVKDLNMHYETLSGDVSAVKNVSFTVKAVSYTHLTLPTTPYV